MMNSKSTTKKNHFANDGTFGLFAHLRKFLMYYFNRQSTNTVTTMFIFSKHLEIPIGLNKNEWRLLQEKGGGVSYPNYWDVDHLHAFRLP